jgi:hypothetical protein
MKMRKLWRRFCDQLLICIVKHHFKERVQMRTPVIGLCFLVVMPLGLVGCGAAHKDVRLTPGQMQGVKKIAVATEQKHDFEVFYSRTKADYGVPVVLGGLVGGAIANGAVEGQDKDATSLMAGSVKDVRCPSIFVESLAPLSASTRFEKVYMVPEASQKAGLSDYDAVVTFTIATWGLRLVERDNDKVAAFVELDVEMVRGTDKKVIWDQREVIVGDRRETLATYTADGEALRKELRETIKRAGFQMANTLIYQ